MGINWNFQKLVKTFFSNGCQHVVLNGQASSAGVSQGSIPSSLFFLIYISDLSENQQSTVKFFADVTPIFQVVKDLEHISLSFKPWPY